MSASLDIVTSVCHEEVPPLAAALQSCAQRLRDAGYDPVRVVVVCKCPPHHARCDKKLPNLGREGHTWLTWLSDQQQLRDLTMFVNPGFLSNANAGGIWHKAFVLNQVAATLARLAHLDRTTLWHTFSDGVDHTVPVRLCRVPAEAGGCSGQVHPRRMRHALLAERRACRSDATQGTGSLRGYCGSNGTRCSMCTGFQAILKCNECACESQGAGARTVHSSPHHPGESPGCVWTGVSDRRSARRPRRVALLAASPSSFAAWACRRWGITPRTVRCFPQAEPRSRKDHT